MESVVFGEVIQQEQEQQKHKTLACSTVPSLFPPVFLLASLPQHSLFSCRLEKRAEKLVRGPPHILSPPPLIW